MGALPMRLAGCYAIFYSKRIDKIVQQKFIRLFKNTKIFLTGTPLQNNTQFFKSYGKNIYDLILKCTLRVKLL